MVFFLDVPNITDCVSLRRCGDTIEASNTGFGVRWDKRESRGLGWVGEWGGLLERRGLVDDSMAVCSVDRVDEVAMGFNTARLT